jgi:hypothetical protein
VRSGLTQINGWATFLENSIIIVPYKGKRPEIGLSMHMAGGWRAQLDRVRRWYHRASSARIAIDRYDFLTTFFENAFHLRDWLVDTGAIPQKTIDDFIKSNEDMRLCRDIANSHKHYSLRNPSQPTPPSETREYHPGFGNLEPDISLVILSDGKKHDAFELAQRILYEWESFISVHVEAK